MLPSPQQTAYSLVHILNTQGQGDYIHVGEPISQLAHSLQAAHQALTNKADEEIVIAALLHDVGQFLPASEVRSMVHEVHAMTSDEDKDSVGRVGHEKIGEAYLLRLGFPQKVASLVGSHAAAKRYLRATDPAYHDTLSEASKRSLMFHGVPMQGGELKEWGANP